MSKTLQAAEQIQQSSASTIKDVAMVAGVSIATVSRVVNKSGVVSTLRQRKVREAICKLSYQPDAAAITLGLRAGRNKRSPKLQLARSSDALSPESAKSVTALTQRVKYLERLISQLEITLAMEPGVSLAAVALFPGSKAISSAPQKSCF